MNTFCVLPWYSNEIQKNRVTPCCLLPTHANIDQIKQDLLSGVNSPACNACWSVESSGQQSRRQTSNMFLEHSLAKDLPEIRNDCITGKSQTMLYQVYVSNLCNQACVSCGSVASSKWATLDKQIGKTAFPIYQVNKSDLQIDYRTVKKIEFYGGEPLFDPTTFEILEKLAEHNTDCFISFVTNGSVEINSKYVDLLTRFTELSICVSIDGTGPVFEYMRWPAKWDTLLLNLQKYRSFAKYITASYTLSSLNALYYDQTIQWFEDMSIPVSHNIVYNPKWLNFDSTPTSLKNALLQKNNFVTHLLDPTTQGIDLNEYHKQILDQDTVKKINLRHYMPEVADLIFYDIQ